MSTTAAGRIAAPGKTGLVLRWIARGILLCIAAFWVWFSIADGLGDAGKYGPLGFIMMLPAAVITLAVLYIAWRWEFAGGIVLLGITLLGGGLWIWNMQRMTLQSNGPRFWEGFLGLGIFVLPFLIPAILLLVKCRLDRQARRAADTPAAAS
jgi:hypothetical protein